MSVRLQQLADSPVVGGFADIVGHIVPMPAGAVHIAEVVAVDRTHCILGIPMVVAVVAAVVAVGWVAFQAAGFVTLGSGIA